MQSSTLTGTLGRFPGPYSRELGTVRRLFGPVDLARFDSTVKVPTEGSGRTSRHQAAVFLCARDATVRACTPPEVLGRRTRGRGAIPGFGSAIDPKFHDATGRDHRRRYHRPKRVLVPQRTRPGRAARTRALQQHLTARHAQHRDSQAVHDPIGPGEELRARSRSKGIELTVDELPGDRLAEELLDTGGAARPVLGGIEPQPTGALAEVAELGDSHRELARPLETTRTVSVHVRPVQLSCPRNVSAGELEQNDRQLLGRVSQTAVLPVDHAQPARRRSQDVVGEQITVTCLQVGRSLEQRLDGDELVALGGQRRGERRADGDKLCDELIPADGADRLGVPPVDRAAPVRA